MCSNRIFLAFTLALFSLLNLGCDFGIRQAQLESKAQAQRAKAVSEELASISQQLQQSTTREEEAGARLADAQKNTELAESRAHELAARLEEANRKILSAQKALAESKSSERNVNVQRGPFRSKLFSWNVESDGSEPRVIAKQLAEFGQYDIYALTEVLPESFDLFRSAAGENYDSIETETGRSDRMQIIYDKTRFDLLQRLELHEINYKLRYRSPLVAHLRDNNTGTEFMVMVNHLARGKAEVRAKQAEQLVAWARDQTLPIIALGDYNYDFVFADRTGNEGFRQMMRDSIWSWVEPIELIDTNWFDNPEAPDGKDDYPGSLLDFAFVAGPAKDWKTTCQIITRPNDFPDDSTTSDHRPYQLLINVE
jgi:hypothetical protein